MLSEASYSRMVIQTAVRSRDWSTRSFTSGVANASQLHQACFPPCLKMATDPLCSGGSPFPSPRYNWLTDWPVDWQNAAMNKINPHLQRSSLMLIVTCLAIGLFLGYPVNASAAGKESPAPVQNELAAGRLVIMRSATLGPTIVGLKIDGKEVAQISYNRSYNAPLAAGSHILTVYPVVSLEGAKPTEIRVNVEPGKTYKFTAARQDIQLVLQKGL